MTRSVRWRWLACASLAAVLGAGCQASRPAVYAGTEKALLVAAADDGMTLGDPLHVDADTKRDVIDRVGFHGDGASKLRRLLAFVRDRGFTFVQTRGTSLPAERAYKERRGDCITYATMIVALARVLDIEAFFVHVRQVQTYFAHDDALFASSHVAVGFGEGPQPLVFDTTNEASPWRLALYTRIDDAAAVALFYNNVAVDEMEGGRTANAERLLSFLVRAHPELAEPHNNLAVVRMRRGEPREALAGLERAIGLFPDYKPLYTNGILAAAAAGRPDLVASLEARGGAIDDTDPLFLFARALGSYQRARYADAVDKLERALDAQPENLVILGWLVRAHLAAGERARGIEAFAHARRVAPDDPRVRELEEQYPLLHDPTP